MAESTGDRRRLGRTGSAVGLLVVGALAGGAAPPADQARTHPPGGVTAAIAAPPAAGPTPGVEALPGAPAPAGSPAPAEPLPAAAARTEPLLPGQAVQPIDLSNVLRLAGARDLDIATARQRVCLALAELQEAWGLCYRASSPGRPITG